MGKHKDKDKKKKEGQLVIRVAKDEKARFLASVEALNSSAGREIRRFMREFVESHAAPVPEADAIPEVPPAPDAPAAAPEADAPAQPPVADEAAGKKKKKADKGKKKK